VSEPVRTFRSGVLEPRARGVEFGAAHGERIAANVAAYRRLFAQAAGGAPLDVEALGGQALAAIEGFAPELHEEILGIAEGAGLAPELLGAVNARTELLAVAGRARRARAAAGGGSVSGGAAGAAGDRADDAAASRDASAAPVRGECSTAVKLSVDGTPPIGVQTWDWYDELAGGWLVWEIPHPDGRRTTTLTEYGIVGKAGVNDRGIGLHFNILHHERDGATVGVPVHVAGRAMLDRAGDVNQALLALHAAEVSASSCLTVVSAEGDGCAVCVELHPGGPGHVLPDERGLLLHTNHFLSQPGAAGDTEPREAPDTLVRLDLLRRRLHGRAALTADELLAAFDCHAGGGGALCCHPDTTLAPEARYATLATVELDVAAGTLRALAGGPCAHRAPEPHTRSHEGDRPC